MSDTSQTIPTAGAYVGQAGLQTPNDALNAIPFLVDQLVAGKAFCKLVQVQSVSGGGIAAPSRVSVQPMVNQVDGLGNQTPHGTVYNLPCFRLQGGGGAIVLDPVVGDIGVAVICDRDISNVKSSGAVSGPGSFRQNDWADGCYFGSFLGAAPTAYIQIVGGNIDMVAPGTISLNGTSISTTGILTNNGKSVGNTHEHSGVQTGGGTSGPPV